MDCLYLLDRSNGSTFIFKLPSSDIKLVLMTSSAVEYDVIKFFKCQIPTYFDALFNSVFNSNKNDSSHNFFTSKIKVIFLNDTFEEQTNQI